MGITVTQKRRSYSAAEKSLLIETYKNSGISAKQWCKENGIGLSTLQRWLQNDKKQANPNPQSWVSVIPVAEERTDVLTVQIGKFAIPVAKNTDMQLLSTVLKVMVEVC